jgi:hypothetical protein
MHFIIVRFEVLTAASMKVAVFWVVAPYSLVEVYRRLRGASDDLPDDGGSKHLWHVGELLPTAQQPRRQTSSYFIVVP